MFMNKIVKSQTCLYNIFSYKKATGFWQQLVGSEGILSMALTLLQYTVEWQ